MYLHDCSGAECPFCSPFGIHRSRDDLLRGARFRDTWDAGAYWRNEREKSREDICYGVDSTGAVVTQYPKRLGVGATIILIVGAMENRQVLCQKRRDNGWWGFPGGSQEIGESIEQCAIREMKEETGLKVELLGATSIDGNPALHGLCSYSDGVVQYTNITFLAELSSVYERGVVPQVRTCEESLLLLWYPLHNLPQPFLFNHRWRFEQAMKHRGAFIPVR